MSTPQVKLNHQIRAQIVRVIDGHTNQLLGDLPKAAALKLAADRDVDLIEISPRANPPVCRLEDYGKFKYSQAKKHRHQTQHKTKEILLHATTDPHDMETKIRHAEEFLRRGDKVKVILKFRGREAQHTEIGFSKVLTFVQSLSEICHMEQEPRQNGRNILCLLRPRTSASPDKTRPQQ